MEQDIEIQLDTFLLSGSRWSAKRLASTGLIQGGVSVQATGIIITREPSTRIRFHIDKQPLRDVKLKVDNAQIFGNVPPKERAALALEIKRYISDALKEMIQKHIDGVLFEMAPTHPGG